jgi:hypothetical protein
LEGIYLRNVLNECVGGKVNVLTECVGGNISEECAESYIMEGNVVACLRDAS